jgi:hypothetical protein
MNDLPMAQTDLQPAPPLLEELRGVIQAARERVARTLYKELGSAIFDRYGARAAS